MCKIICVTNRKLCRENFIDRLEKTAAARPDAILLREKDLSVEEYTELAEKVMKICEDYGVGCILHNFPDVAKKLGCPGFHGSVDIIRKVSTDKNLSRSFRNLGASCHCAEDAAEAEKLGCTYIFAGHIFATECKKGLAPRGTDFLADICLASDIPVYAIGGIGPSNAAQAVKAGASGVCIMSGLMTCDDPAVYMTDLRRKMNEI